MRETKNGRFRNWEDRERETSTLTLFKKRERDLCIALDLSGLNCLRKYWVGQKVRFVFPVRWF